MTIVKMKHIRLLAMNEDREALLHQLQRLGCVEVQEVPEDDQALAALPRPDSSTLSQARERQQTLTHALEVLKRYAPAKEGMFRVRPRVTEGKLYDDAAFARALESAEKINQAEHRLQGINSEKSRRETAREGLRPWLPLDTPLELRGTQTVRVQMGTLPAQLSLVTAKETLGDLAELELISQDKKSLYLLAIYHISQEEGAMEALKNLGWSKAGFQNYQGTAAANDQRLKTELAALEKETEEQLQSLTQLGDEREALRWAIDRATVDLQREESKARLRSTEQTFYLNGWVEAPRWPEVEKALANYACAYEVWEPEEAEYPETPVKLHNNWLTKPLNMITDMYSLPAYGSLDPNPLMAPFFILFYGIMMADMGYGILMFLAGLIIHKKYRPKGTMGHMMGLLELCGISTFLFGVITGGFFGDFIPQLAKMINPESTLELPSLFTPLNDTVMILIGAMCLGFVQIISGMAISFVEKLKRRQFLDALFEEVTWWIVFAGAALMILKITPYVLILGGVLVLAGPLITGKGMGKITGIFGSLYNHVTGYFGDILSYSRLMALMLAGSVIAQVFNTLGAIFGNVVMFVIISMAGNLLNFALNLLSCYVHDLRLQCLEYFNKFYKDGGKAFQPLAFNTKYVDVE